MVGFIMVIYYLLLLLMRFLLKEMTKPNQVIFQAISKTVNIVSIKIGVFYIVSKKAKITVQRRFI